MEDVPAALGRRRFHGPAGHQRAPVHRLHVDLAADLLQQIARDERDRVEHRDVGRVQHHDRPAIVPGLLHELARVLEVRLGRRPGARAVLALADEVRAALPEVLRLADRRLQVLLLVRHVHQGLPGLLVVEGWLEMVGADPALVADGVVRDDGDVRVLLDLRDQVERRLLPDVDLTGLEGGGGGCRVGDVAPDQALDVHVLAAGGATRGLVTRDVLGVAQVDDLVAGLPLLLHELVRSRPDGVLDHLLLGRGREAGGQDEGHDGGGLGQGLQHQAKGFAQLEHEGPLVGRLQPLRGRQEKLAERITVAPALEGHHAVLGGHRLAVVELQAVAQREAPFAAVLAARPLVHHLRLDLAVAVQREERVVDQVAIGAVGDVAGVARHIENAEVRVRDEAQRAALLLCLDIRRREGECGGGGRASHEKLATARVHHRLLPNVEADTVSRNLGRRQDHVNHGQDRLAAP